MPKDAELNLWHYTTAEGLKGILSDQTLWATDYRYLNDTLEFNYSKTLIHQALLPKAIHIIKERCKVDPEAKRITEMHGGYQNTAGLELADALEIPFESMLLNEKPFVLSFCKVPVNDSFEQKNGLLSQWRGYGKDGGYAIIFDANELISEFKIETNSFYHGIAAHRPIVYDTINLVETDDMKKYLDLICEFILEFFELRISGKGPPSPDKIVGPLFGCMAFIKHKGFEEEKEYRFCVMPHCKEWQNGPYFEIDNKKSFKEIKIRDNDGALVPYIRLFEKSKKLAIKRICVGPHREKESRVKAIETYLSGIGLDKIEVFCSDIPYIGSK